MKTCLRCKEHLSLDMFTVNNKKPDGKAIYCKPCKAKYKKSYIDSKRDQASKHNIDTEFLKELLSKGCTICTIKETRLMVDHDHSCCPGERTCGKCIRGILCDKCNRGLGFFNDNPDLLQRAIEYLAVSRVAFTPYISTYIKRND